MAKGEIKWIGPNGTLIRDMQKCIHCGGGWIIDPTGPERGFCRNCMGPTCGKKGCVTDCANIEKRLILAETKDLQECGHCNISWIPEPGSGRIRGWCFICKAHLCGSMACANHYDRKQLYTELFQAVNNISQD